MRSARPSAAQGSGDRRFRRGGTEPAASVRLLRPGQAARPGRSPCAGEPSRPAFGDTGGRRGPCLETGNGSSRRCRGGLPAFGPPGGFRSPEASGGALQPTACGRTLPRFPDGPSHARHVLRGTHWRCLIRSGTTRRCRRRTSSPLAGSAGLHVADAAPAGPGRQRLAHLLPRLFPPGCGRTAIAGQPSLALARDHLPDSVIERPRSTAKHPASRSMLLSVVGTPPQDADCGGRKAPYLYLGLAAQRQVRARPVHSPCPGSRTATRRCRISAIGRGSEQRPARYGLRDGHAVATSAAQAGGCPFDQQAVPDFHMASRIVASFRLAATMAFFMQVLFALRRPQA